MNFFAPSLYQMYRIEVDLVIVVIAKLIRSNYVFVLLGGIELLGCFVPQTSFVAKFATTFEYAIAFEFVAVFEIGTVFVIVAGFVIDAEFGLASTYEASAFKSP